MPRLQTQAKAKAKAKARAKAMPSNRARRAKGPARAASDAPKAGEGDGIAFDSNQASIQYALAGAFERP